MRVVDDYRWTSLAMALMWDLHTNVLVTGRRKNAEMCSIFLYQYLVVVKKHLWEIRPGSIVMAVSYRLSWEFMKKSNCLFYDRINVKML